MIKKCRSALCVGICVFASFAQNAFAQNNEKNAPYTTFFIPAVYSIDNAWNQQEYDFTAQNLAGIAPASGHANDLYWDKDAQAALNLRKKSFKSDDDDVMDNLMKKIPYSKSLKYTWNLVDGDVDILYIENLRVDRRNKGVSYRTKSLPLVGEMQGSEIKAELGEDSKVTFKSDYMPLVGRVDGLQFKASAGTDDSQVSVRYKTGIDW